jgi:hypothetical protein
MANFLSGTPFVPSVGKCYEVYFGKIKLDDKEGHCWARVKVNGLHTSQWEDIDTGQPLDPRIAVYVVRAFKETQCPDP